MATKKNNPTSTTVANNGNELQKFIEKCGGEFFAADSETAKDTINAAKAKEYPDFGRDIPVGKYKVCNKVTVKAHKRSDGRVSNIWCCVIVALDGKVGEHYLLQLAALRTPNYPLLREDGTRIEFNAIVPVRQGAPTSEMNQSVLTRIVGEPEIQLHHAFGHNDNPNATRIWNRILTWTTLAK